MALSPSAVAWMFGVSALESELPSLQRVLSEDERERARRFVRPNARRTYVAGRGVLRLLLGAQIGCRPENVCISYNRFGKPVLPGDSGPFFNVSHSADRIAVALGTGAHVGVDVEWVREERDWPDLARRYFAPREARYVESLPPPARNRAFFEIWTRKEAYLKALGRGLSVPLNAFCVPVGRIEACDGPLVDDGSGQWQVRPLLMEHGFVGAAVVRTGVQLQQHLAPPFERAMAPDGGLGAMDTY